MFYHDNYDSSLKTLQESIPLFFNRYRYIIMSYALLRERMIYNNSLSSFEDPNLDEIFYHHSLENEELLNQLKQSHHPIVD